MFQAFKAMLPVGKQMVTRVYSSATARNAGRFLQAVMDELLFPVLSIQADGGSEFMADFEQVCQGKGGGVWEPGHKRWP